MTPDWLHAAVAAESPSARGSEQLQSLQAVLEQAASSRDAAGFLLADYSAGLPDAVPLICTTCHMPTSTAPISLIVVSAASELDRGR